jgi:hypothetical protein
MEKGSPYPEQQQPPPPQYSQPPPGKLQLLTGGAGQGSIRTQRVTHGSQDHCHWSVMFDNL